jgi:hypothetical protein
MVSNFEDVFKYEVWLILNEGRARAHIASKINDKEVLHQCVALVHRRYQLIPRCAYIMLHLDGN